MRNKKPTYAIGSYLDHSSLKRVDQTSDLVDPHIWFSPEIWMEGLEGLANELDKVEGLSQTKENYDAYAKQISGITEKLRQDLDSNLAKGKRILITSHDAFNYFGRCIWFSGARIARHIYGS